MIIYGLLKGILDYISSKKRASCSDLFVAIARTQPPLYCFGHIYKGYGVKLMTWREHIRERSNHLTDTDNGRGMVIEKLSGLRASELDSEDLKEEKIRKLEERRRDRYYVTSHCQGDEHKIERGRQTLFMNAAIQGTEEEPVQLPWLVDIELLRAG